MYSDVSRDRVSSSSPSSCFARDRSAISRASRCRLSSSIDLEEDEEEVFVFF